MADTDSAFMGSISRAYDNYLGPILFEPFAQDMADRLPATTVQAVLELACGTGRYSKWLRRNLPKEANLICSDLNPDMLSIAQEHMIGQQVDWKIVDMQAISFPDQSFDFVTSQFGVMFPPNKLKAFTEVYRVLRPSGLFLFSTWDKIRYNGFADIGNRIVKQYFPDNPTAFYESPFCLHNAMEVRDLLEEAGFTDVKITMVRKKGIAESVSNAARGLIEGNPIYLAIMDRDPALLETIQNATEKALTEAYGDNPMVSPLQAWVFEAVKK